MSRPLRIIVEGLPIHHIQRGNNKQPVFLDDGDRRLYRELLLEGSQRFGLAVHAWVFMTNHVHLLLTPERADGLSRLTEWMGARYVCFFNRRHGRTGRLWQGRFHSSVVESSRYFLTCSRYIDQNPVRAGLCRHPQEHAWSSYARLAYGLYDPLVTEHAEYLALGRSAQVRQAMYRQMCATPLERPVINRLRSAPRRGEVLGEAYFLSAIEQRTGRCGRRQPHGGARRGSREVHGAEAVP